MKTLKCLLIAVVWICFDSVVLPAWQLGPQPEPPDLKTITLSKGTKVEKLGPGHFKFRLPDGQTVEVKDYSKGGGAAAIIGDCGIYDRAGKLTATGKQASLKSGPKPTEDKHMKSSRNIIMIDDEPTWLPATVTFRIVSGGKGTAPKPETSSR